MITVEKLMLLLISIAILIPILSKIYTMYKESKLTDKEVHNAIKDTVNEIQKYK